MKHFEVCKSAPLKVDPDDVGAIELSSFKGIMLRESLGCWGARSQVEKDPDHDLIGLLSQYIMVSPVFCFFPLVLFLHLRVSLGEV